MSENNKDCNCEKKCNEEEIIIDVLTKSMIEDYLKREISDKEFSAIKIAWEVIIAEPQNPVSTFVEFWIRKQYEGQIICPSCGNGFEEDDVEAYITCECYVFSQECKKGCIFCSEECRETEKANCPIYNKYLAKTYGKEYTKRYKVKHKNDYKTDQICGECGATK